MKRRAAAERALSMPRSAIREIMALASTRENVIHLEIGEPDFSTPEHIITGAFNAVKEGFTKYTPNPGLPTLRAGIAEHVSNRPGCKVDPEQVVVTTGAVGGLFGALMAVTDIQDEVLVPDPGWPNYESIVHLAGAKAVRFTLDLKSGFVPSTSQLEALVTDKTKVIMMNTPGNPTGVVFSHQTMEEIAELAKRYGLYVISDEVYEDIIFEGEHISAASYGLEDQLFLVSGASKSYAMTGWRLGYVICPSDLANVVASLQEPVASCAPSISQKAYEVALSANQNCVLDFKEIYRRRRDILVEEFGNTGLLPVVPAGAFYSLVNITERHAKNGSLEFAKKLLLETNVAVVPGITFGPSCDKYVRVAFTTDDQALRKGLKILRDFIQHG